METLDAIGRQRVSRRFPPDPLPDDALSTILDAGRHAGSSKNLQRWAFVVVARPGHAGATGRRRAVGGHIAGAAVAIALVTPDPHTADEPLSVMWDLGRAAQNMTLAAWDLGIGSCPATVYEHDALPGDPGLPRRPPLRVHPELRVSRAHPVDLTRPLKAGGRHDRASMVHEERW